MIVGSLYLEVFQIIQKHQVTFTYSIWALMLICQSTNQDFLSEQQKTYSSGVIEVSVKNDLTVIATTNSILLSLRKQKATSCVGNLIRFILISFTGTKEEEQREQMVLRLVCLLEIYLAACSAAIAAASLARKSVSFGSDLTSCAVLAMFG